MTESPKGGWLFLPPEDVPERWRDRAVPMVLVPLLPEEAARVLAHGSAGVNGDEERLVRLVAQGRSVRQMARELGISTRGVQHRLAKLRMRFKVASTVELACELAKRGFSDGTQRTRNATGGSAAHAE